MKTKALVSMTAMLTLCLFGGSAAHSADSYVLRFSHMGPASDINDDAVGANALKKYIEEKSNKRVTVKLFPGSQLGNQDENMDQMNTKTIEGAHTSIAAITPYVPELSVIDLQYILPSDAVVYKFMDGPFIKKMGEAVKEKLPNVKLVSVSDTGRWRSFYTTKKQVKTASDLKGLKIRTINSPVQMEFVKSLGGAAAPIPWGEVYTALATGLVDGTKNATPDIMSNKFNETVKYGIQDRHTFLMGFYFINEGWLTSLPKDLQEIVLEGFKEGAKAQTKFNKDVEEKSNAAFTSGGGTLYEPSPEDKATFSGARKTMMDWYTAKYGDKWLKEFLSAVELAKKEAGEK